jgi:hypothetical protein
VISASAAREEEEEDDDEGRIDEEAEVLVSAPAVEVEVVVCAWLSADVAVVRDEASR